MPLAVSACLVLALAPVACGGDPTDPSRTAYPVNSPTGAVAAAVGDQTVATVRTQPDSLLMIAGDNTTVTAGVFNAAGEGLSRSVTWTVGSTSLITVLSKTGTTLKFKARKRGIATVKATVDGKSGTTKIVIRDAAGARLIVSPHTASLAPLATQQFVVSGRSSTGETATVSATWTGTGGTVSGTGAYAAGTVPGTYRVVAKAPFGAADTGAVTITPSPIVALVVTPTSAMLEAGASLQFTSYGRNALGDSVDVPTTWTTTGGDISGGGLYTAGTTGGTFEVKGTLTSGSLSATASVTTTVPSGGGGGGGGTAGVGIPYGLFGMSGRKLVDPYTSASQAGQPDSILLDLAAAKARGARIVVNFAGGAANVKDADGHFDYGVWQARVDRYLPILDDLNAYVADGTLLAFLVIDEPFASGTWGGQTVPKATIDQMAQYAHSLFPGLPAVVRAAPTQMQGYAWQYVDLAWAQYTVKKGPIAQYASNEFASAKAQGLGLVAGLNISKGGDGSSGFGFTDGWSMSGAEILQYGAALLDDPYACAFISWDNRSSVITPSDVAAALQDLATAALAHAATSCRR
ncbi:MAG: hypothetical protein ABI860_10045 [Gemmatimonadales bacterium]